MRGGAAHRSASFVELFWWGNRIAVGAGTMAILESPIGPGRTASRRSRRESAEGGYPRLLEPLVREHGSLRAATWDEALDRAAAAFSDTIERRGPRAIGMFSCSKATNEVNYLAQKFARAALGMNNIDSCNRT